MDGVVPHSAGAEALVAAATAAAAASAAVALAVVVAASAVAARQAGGRSRDMRAETFFSEQEKERINQAVIAAEQNTSGEIVPMVVTASARYTEIELLGVIIGLGIGTLAAAVFGDPWRQDFA